MIMNNNMRDDCASIFFSICWYAIEVCFLTYCWSTPSRTALSYAWCTPLQEDGGRKRRAYLYYLLKQDLIIVAFLLLQVDRTIVKWIIKTTINRTMRSDIYASFRSVHCMPGIGLQSSVDLDLKYTELAETHHRVAVAVGWAWLRQLVLIVVCLSTVPRSTPTPSEGQVLF
jgi:hypothetical protein